MFQSHMFHSINATELKFISLLDICKFPQGGRVSEYYCEVFMISYLCYDVLILNLNFDGLK